MNADQSSASLQAILGYARAGATTRAWEQFATTGLDQATADPKVLTLKGRLLKDQARKTTGEAQAELYRRSATAYTDAARLRPDSYPLINAATMSLFAGQAEQVEMLATQVLTLLENGMGAGETPYWHEATKAEALLLLGRRSEAAAALDKGVAFAPQAWEDHATTLRQFRAIVRHQGSPQDWLATYAPPPSIHFKGIMGIAPDDQAAADAVDARLLQSGARFAYGALAAGADILLGEAMLRQGGELHVVLPVMLSAFKARSVEPYGGEWSRRFDALFEQAASVEIVGHDDHLSRAAIDLAAEVAKGRAIDNASRLGSEALSFVVAETPSAPADDDTLFVEVRRSAIVENHVELEIGQRAVYIATDAPDRITGIDWRKSGSVDIGIAGSPAHLAAVLQQVQSANPQAAIAVHAAVAADSSVNDVEAAKLERLVQTAAPGTVIGSGTAAMLVKASHPSAWIEPLGELPDPSGAISVYAIGRFDSTMLQG